jgi:hypothetical protein
MIMIALTAKTQNSTIRGTVFDGVTNETMPGVAIVVSGTTIGTTTDLDGKFSLSVEPGIYNFEVSFISYQTLKITRRRIYAY